MSPQDMTFLTILLKLLTSEGHSDLVARARKIAEDDQSLNEPPWKTVGNGKANKRRRTEETPKETNLEANQNPRAAPKPMPRTIFKTKKPADGPTYAYIAALEKDHPGSDLRAKPDIRGRYNISTANPDIITNLRNTEHLVELKPEEKITKMIVQHFPVEIQADRLLECPNVTTAERCKNNNVETRQVLVTIKGPRINTLNVGIYGQFSLRLYNPEPMRCYRCQRFGHHKDGCRGPERCGVCSELHNTDICKNLYKEGKQTKAKCPNCGDTHHAWNKRCPERVKRILAFGSTQQPKVATSRPQSTRPSVKSQWYTPRQVRINENQQTNAPISSSLSNNWRKQRSTTPQGNRIDQGRITNIPAIASKTSQAEMMIPTSSNAPVAGCSKDASTQPRVSSPTKKKVATPVKKTQAAGKITTVKTMDSMIPL